MKLIRPFSILAVALFSLLPALVAQDEAVEEAPAPDEDRVVPDWLKAFQNLKDSEQEAYKKHLVEASRLFNQKRIIEALNEVGDAQKIFDQGPSAYNLLGACQVEFRNFDKAREAFKEALKLQEQYLENLKGIQGDARLRRMRPVVNILFNIAEMDFVTGNWQACHDRIEKILPEIDPKNQSMGRLMEFKYLLCKIKLGQVDEARKLAEKYDFLDDFPYYYYANAAMAYHDKREEEAERWRTSARRVFRRAQILAPWEDTMIEFGYVKSFYGGVDSESE